MANKKMTIRIYPDGKVEAKTINIKGKKCELALDVLGEIMSAKILESTYTPEYYQTEEKLIQDNTLENILYEE